MIHFGKQTSWRYERKFLVEQAASPYVMPGLQKLKARFVPAYQPRIINNIYLDTPGLAGYYANEDGAYHKQKVRIRWYGQEGRRIEKPVLEIKTKEGMLGYKMQYALPAFVLDTSLGTVRLQALFAKANLPPAVAMYLKTLHPVLFNTYARQYFDVANGAARITIDNNMSFCKMNVLGSLFLGKYHNYHDTIVELKYDQAKARQAEGLMAQMPFALSKCSKYVMGLEAAVF